MQSCWGSGEELDHSIKDNSQALKPIIATPSLWFLCFDVLLLEQALALPTVQFELPSG